MKCPIDGTPLVITDRTGIEIDYCPTCRGIWLDRGELDKIIERTSSYTAAPAAPNLDDDDDRKGRKKRGGFADFLDDIFDF